MTGRHQDFYDHWYNRPQESKESDFSNTLPYVLSLGGKDKSSSLPFRGDKTSGKILVTKAYDDMFHRILLLRLNDYHGTKRGVVLTGQPGLGASVTGSHPMP